MHCQRDDPCAPRSRISLEDWKKLIAGEEVRTTLARPQQAGLKPRRHTAAPNFSRLDHSTPSRLHAGMAGAYHDLWRGCERHSVRAIANGAWLQLDPLPVRGDELQPTCAPYLRVLLCDLHQSSLPLRPAQPDRQPRFAFRVPRMRPSPNRPPRRNRSSQTCDHGRGALRRKDSRPRRCLLTRARHKPVQRAQNQRRKGAQHHSQHQCIAQSRPVAVPLLLELPQILTSSVWSEPVTQARPSSVSIFTSLRTPNSPGR